jgi:phage/plasmid primase-like uncharacterized protein
MATRTTNDESGQTEAEKAAADKAAAAEKAAAEQAAANKLRDEAAKEAGKNTGYAVAKGLSITSLRGHLDEGTSVSARDFTHGEKDIEDLLSRGALVRT